MNPIRNVILPYTENRFYFYYKEEFEFLVRVTGKEIEQKFAKEEKSSKWELWCKSYTISNDVLTFTGGRGDGMSYKKGAPSGGSSTATTVPKELIGKWYNIGNF